MSSLTICSDRVKRVYFKSFEISAESKIDRPHCLSKSMIFNSRTNADSIFISATIFAISALVIFLLRLSLTVLTSTRVLSAISLAVSIDFSQEKRKRTIPILEKGGGFLFSFLGILPRRIVRGGTNYTQTPQTNSIAPTTPLPRRRRVWPSKPVFPYLSVLTGRYNSHNIFHPSTTLR